MTYREALPFQYILILDLDFQDWLAFEVFRSRFAILSPQWRDWQQDYDCQDAPHRRAVKRINGLADDTR